MSNTDDIQPPKVTGSPERIWLVYGDIERDCTHAECCQSGEVTWCEDGQFSSGVQYVRADALTAQAEELTRMRCLVQLNNDLCAEAEAKDATIAAQAAQIEALRADAERLRSTLNFIAEHLSTDWPERCQSNVLAARAAMQSGKAVTP